MDPLRLSAADLADLAERGVLRQLAGVALGQPVMLVDLDDRDRQAVEGELATDLAMLPAVLIGIAGSGPAVTGPGDRGGGPLDMMVDVVAGSEAEAEKMAARVRAHPLAATSLALLLRTQPLGGAATGPGLVAESATFSMLQAGPEYAAWRGRHRTAAPDGPRTADDRPRIRHHIDGSTRRLTLTRPHKHNALDTAMLNELVEALTTVRMAAVDDPSLTLVLDGEGPSFCTGGDLDEFGTRADPVNAHTVRLTRSAGALVDALADRTTVHLHGWTLGGGLEVAAFAGRVVAHPDARLGLPELGLGLIPGAGGTVSVPRRIGRQATMALALADEPWTAATALAAGLVDAVADAWGRGLRNPTPVH